MASRKLKIVLITVAVLITVVIIFRKPFIRATLPEIVDVALGEIVLRNDSAFVNISLIVRNKGVWHIDLKQVTLGVYDDTLQILSYVNDTLMTLERYQVKRQELYCTIPLKQVMQRIRDHQGQDTVGLRLRGELVYSTIFGEMSTTIDKRIPVNVPIPPRLSIRGIEYAGKEDGGYNLLFHLNLKNDNPRELELKDVNYALHGENGIDMYGQLDNITIAAQDSTQLWVPGRLEIDNRFALISQILLDKDMMAYSFVMTGTIESFTGIVKDDVPITVNSYGQMEIYNEDKRDRPKVTFRKKQR
jgi:hypothetical protein